MKRWRLGGFVAVLFLSNVLSAYAGDDSEFWPMVQMTMKVNEKTKILLLEEFRLNDDMGSFYTHVQYLGPYYSVNKYLDLGLLYKLVNAKGADEWNDSHRIDMDVVLKTKWQGFSLSNRTRFEHNFNETTWLCRDRVKVAKKVKVLGKEITPFVSNEFFWDIYEKDGWHENRSDVGFSMPFVWDTDLTLYYRSRLKEHTGDWTNANIFGTIISYEF